MTQPAYQHIDLAMRLSVLQKALRDGPREAEELSEARRPWRAWLSRRSADKRRREHALLEQERQCGLMAEWRRQEDERVETRRQARERYGMYIAFSDGTYG